MKKGVCIAFLLFVVFMDYAAVFAHPPRDHRYKETVVYEETLEIRKEPMPAWIIVWILLFCLIFPIVYAIVHCAVELFSGMVQTKIGFIALVIILGIIFYETGVSHFLYRLIM